MLRNYFKIAWRNLRKNKLFSLVNMLGLTAGLASCILICLYIYDEYNFDTHHKNVEQLYQVGTILKRSDGDIRTAGTPYGIADALETEFPEIEKSTRLVSLFVDDKTLFRYSADERTDVFYETRGYLTDKNFFDLFSYDFVEGSSITALDQPNSIVISADMAKKMFGNQPALNKTLEVESNTNGKGLYTVTGVFKKAGTPSHIDGRFFMSFEGGALDNYVKTQTSMAGNNFVLTYVFLKKGTDHSSIEQKFPSFVDKYLGPDLAKAGFDKEQFLLPVLDIHLRSGMVENVTPSGNTKQLFILFSIAVFTLVIACINYMNLSTARSSQRAGEVGIRKVLGAQKGGLIKQFLVESMLIALISFVFAVVAVWLLIGPFEAISGKSFNYSTGQYLLLGSVFCIISLLTGALSGSYPAFFLSAFNPIKVLKGKITNTLGAVFLRKGLVVFQFTIAMVLIVASVVIFNQMSFLKTTDLGFSKDHQIVLPLRSEAAANNLTSLKDELKRLPEVKSVGAAAYYPGIFNPEDAVFYKNGSNMNLGKHMLINRVDNEFLRTLDMELIAGRLFSEKFVDSIGFVVNETAIKELGFESANEAIGQPIYSEIQGELWTSKIIGVIKDFHFKDLKSPITPFAFDLEDSNFNYLIAHVNGSNIKESISALNAIWSKLLPDQPFEYSFLDQDFQKNYMAENRLSKIVAYFTLIAILISCLGLFGLISFSADQRRKEIGVRKVLGASISNIVKSLSKDFMLLVGIAIILAVPISWWAMNAWLQEFAYKIELGWWMFAIAAILAILIAFVTLASQAIRAATANPVDSLRTE